VPGSRTVLRLCGEERTLAGETIAFPRRLTPSGRLPGRPSMLCKAASLYMRNWVMNRALRSLNALAVASRSRDYASARPFQRSPHAGVCCPTAAIARCLHNLAKWSSSRRLSTRPLAFEKRRDISKNWAIVSDRLVYQPAGDIVARRDMVTAGVLSARPFRFRNRDPWGSARS